MSDMLFGYMLLIINTLVKVRLHVEKDGCFCRWVIMSLIRKHKSDF